MTDFSDNYKRFDAADYLGDLDDVARFLEVAVEDSVDDPSALPTALRVVARSRYLPDLASRVGTTDEALARELAVDDPRITTVLTVTNALGLRFALRPVA